MVDMHQRPDPDQLLAGLQAETATETRGKLKIFLGYAAGVGKTYAMLAAAHQRKAAGVDVVIGYIETHGRVETEALVAGLDIVPRLQVAYRGIGLPEMDVDGVLARRPQLALVDELAHTNAPGARHPKRYQDIEDLLAAGIDVYTTVNIQHLESLNDVVAQITGVIVRETIPDRILDEVHEIELVDLPPVELLARLREGKVYVPQQAAHALEKFFRQGNLIALRELALRRAAERVDDQMRAYMQTRAILGPWSAAERLLVCVSPSPLSERLVRAGRRLADELNAEWFAIYVETASQATHSAAQRDQVARHLQLAEALGAKTLTLPGHDVAAATVTYARQHNITKIIAGKPLRPRWREWLQASIVDRLIRLSGPIDIYVISGDASVPPTPRWQWPPRSFSWRYVQSLGLVAAATIVGLMIDPPLSLARLHFWRTVVLEGERARFQPWPPPTVEPTNLAMIYLTMVVIAALTLGRGPAVLAAVLSSLAFDFLFVQPYLSFVISDTQYVLTFFGLLIVGLVISNLTARVREQVEVAQQRTLQTLEMYELSRDLAAIADLEQIVQTVLRHVEQSFALASVIFLPVGDHLQQQASSPGLTLDENERAVADWVFRHGEPAGQHTDTLPAANLRYLPLKTPRMVVGVLGIATPTRPSSRLTPEQRRLMEAFANQGALAIERARLAEEARQLQVLQTTEKLQSALLNSISHDLRTPLVSITGALSTLAEADAGLAAHDRSALIENARTEAERLNRLVGNLLDMTRLEAGVMKVVRTPSDVQDLVGAALEQLGKRLDDRHLLIDIASDLPLVALDFSLFVQVLVNLLDNALKYAPPQQPITVTARRTSNPTRESTDGRSWLALAIADGGSGIPASELPHIFDKFYRLHHPQQNSGAGLGLSICKGIMEAHGGVITARNRADGGAIFTVYLPLEPEDQTHNE